MVSETCISIGGSGFKLQLWTGFKFPAFVPFGCDGIKDQHHRNLNAGVKSF